MRILFNYLIVTMFDNKMVVIVPNRRSVMVLALHKLTVACMVLTMSLFSLTCGAF